MPSHARSTLSALWPNMPGRKRIFQLDIENLPDEFPPLKTLSLEQGLLSRLPLPVTREITPARSRGMSRAWRCSGLEA